MPDGAECNGHTEQLHAMNVERTGRRWVGLRGATVGAGLCVALALGLFALLYDPGIPAADANGSYAHDCCGTMVVRDGQLSFGTDKTVGYVVERDEKGPYILPRTYVGPWEERGFEIDGTRPPVKLRLDTIPKPNIITLTTATTSYPFKRKPPPVRRPARALK